MHSETSYSDSENAQVEPQKVQVLPAPDRILWLRIFPRQNQAIAQQSKGCSQNGPPQECISSEVPVGYGPIFFTIYS